MPRFGALVRTSVRQRTSGPLLDDPMFGLDLIDDETAKQDLGELGGAVLTTKPSTLRKSAPRRSHTR